MDENTKIRIFVIIIVVYILGFLTAFLLKNNPKFVSSNSSSSPSPPPSPPSEIRNQRVNLNQNKQNHHWSYGGENNPTRWGEISEEFSFCEEGKKQSPINLEELKLGEDVPLNLNYQPTSLIVENNGHTIQISNESESFATFGNEKYKLIQFHFHTPSEHLVAGKAYGMEMHLVHKNSAGDIAVIGVLFKEGKQNEVLESIWENIPSTVDKIAVNKTININDLLPNNLSYYRYEGSLTTPPCSENVKWHVLSTPLEVSPQQIEKFEAIFHVNARPIQPINEREIEFNPL
jgi:carbonic anhydrase